MAARPPDPAPPRISRLPLALRIRRVTINGTDRDLAITPDGSRLVYIGNGGTQIFVRALDALESVPVFTGDGPRGLFVSPDGQWIGFADGAGMLRKVAMTGGPSVPLTPVDGAPRGGTWGPDDTIIFATVTRAPACSESGPREVCDGAHTPRPQSGRSRSPLARDPARWPRRAVHSCGVDRWSGCRASRRPDLQTGTRTVLLRGGSHAHYVSSGHLVYTAADTLRAVAFDLALLETRGTPVPVVPKCIQRPAAAWTPSWPATARWPTSRGAAWRLRTRRARSCR